MKCALAVKKSMVESAQRVAVCQESSHSTPNAPAERNTSSDAKRTISTAIRLPAGYLLQAGPRNCRKALGEIEDSLQKIYQLSEQVAASPSRPNDTAMPSIDQERDKVIRTLNLIWRALGIAEMRLPTEFTLYEEIRDPDS